MEGSDSTNSYVNKNKTNSIIRTSNISVTKKDDNTPTSKRSSIKISNISNKNSLVGSVIRKRRSNLANKGFCGIMRAITTSSGIHKNLIKKDANKLLRVGSALKSLQEQIKKTLILRPEDLVLDLSEGTKIKKEKTIINQEKKESKKNVSSQSILPHLNKKYDLDITKKNTNDIKNQENIPII